MYKRTLNNKSSVQGEGYGLPNRRDAGLRQAGGGGGYVAAGVVPGTKNYNVGGAYQNYHPTLYHTANNQTLYPVVNQSMNHPSVYHAANQPNYTTYPTVRQPRRQVKEATAAVSAPTVPSSSGDLACILNRYFTEDIVQLDRLRGADGKLRPLVASVKRQSKPGNSGNCVKLLRPLERHTKQRTTALNSLFVSKTSSIRGEPLLLFAGKRPVYTLSDLQNMELVKGADRPTETVEPRQVEEKNVTGSKRPVDQVASGGGHNDSFDLSFDGKAMDRSDIFRMVDSFSIAPDEDDDEDPSPTGRQVPRNILPAEITNDSF
ncbi:uncharacterized protein KNAG_0G03490 [Huiozyma naganishii CBS 8797]|uniref:Uncharacterized protein n=1 Tax=Huiozyma naganishii (strain ATCC MYA-139 / BCRC 22969 / CBS 8797 / KCTC 17520 / NBRC 10181 / NCYC 3082 / Yp74L-3) TaxID=1071383 RepID=J7S1D3_HUIN7|nr:hypothetical protein KNAG_0G03490 [Kazachstania naganishii CBS 8797]CCK71407.1 hypothetical protein KNAG_0G03490 [Kazachstania naganishii CBS 8797]